MRVVVGEIAMESLKADVLGLLRNLSPARIWRIWCEISPSWQPTQMVGTICNRSCPNSGFSKAKTSRYAAARGNPWARTRCLTMITRSSAGPLLGTRGGFAGGISWHPGMRPQVHLNTVPRKLDSVNARTLVGLIWVPG
jgi:hypothetical protein